MLSPDPNTALMQRVAAGDSDALALLCERTYADVHALCQRLSQRPDLADDLAQETFLRVLRYAASFRGQARFSTWVYRIARNVCLDHMSRQARHPHVPLNEAEEPSELPASKYTLLEQALGLLPAEKREALVLVRLHGLPYAEAATVLGCSPGAARVRVSRALRDLREIIHALQRPHVL